MSHAASTETSAAQKSGSDSASVDEVTLLGPGAAVLAFDVGGTDMKAALVDSDGQLRETLRTPTPLEGEGTGRAVVATAARLASELTARHADVSPAAAGLLVPGNVDDVRGIGVFAENLGWVEYPFRDEGSAALGLPVAFGHDVRGAGEAEHRLGAARGFDDVLVVTIGTGIAAAVYVGGRLHTGGGLAGEIGHDRVAEGPVCACGGRGCLEAVASAAAIARRYTARTGRSVSGAREVLDRMHRGDANAAAAWESALDALAIGFSHAVALLAPQAIVVGGGLSEAGEELLQPLRERLDGILTFHRRPLLIKASIGADAGLYGSALAARDVAASEQAEQTLTAGGHA
ncbi:ROK family protein [Planctomonas sp. JC2975]|uniref:ROK family protein n=1 Tax=Planctomonas sp. JC2975 TaxID=2729626 RepID=UPI0014763E92|nr:ROK family protein [Planctomonas sp. JC2975]NNC11718.1 ROK family protein [Planctomonas sp. JC2975]